MNAWDKRDLKFLQTVYPWRPTKAVAEALHRPVAAVKCMAIKLGIRKADAYLQSQRRPPRKPKTDRRHWSQAEKQLLTELYKAKVPMKEIASRIKRRYDSTCRMTLQLGLKERVPHRPKKPWKRADKAQLRKLYPHRPTLEIANTMDRHLDSVYRMAHQLGLKKTADFAESELSGRISKGIVPANKGLRRPGFAPGRMAETQFKKGELSGRARQLLKPVGTILTDSEGFLRIKIRERKPGDPSGWARNIWPLLSWHVWETHNKRRVPPKHLIKYIDGDRNNCAIENLKLQSKADNARENHWKNLPEDIRELIHLKAAIKHRITTHERKRKENGEHNREFENSSVRSA